MHYISTRGKAPIVDFKGALLAGLASDGGLYVPESLPHFSPAEIAAMAPLTYEELAFTLLKPFVGDSFTDAQLRACIDKAYASFRHSAIAPLVQLGPQHFVLELFHGPTLAFKDFALQLVGHLMDEALKDSADRAVVLGATSGDTGSAAIAGCRGRANLDIVILYPRGRTSAVQRRQMTTTGEANVHAMEVDGTFDDCQDLVKALFADAQLRAGTTLLAVNSINWVRVLAQVVYYFYAALRLGAPANPLNFCVPTGNFGDIFAGYIARQMGLPMGKLMIATNKNDILSRAVHSGEYAITGVDATLSPSMDIQIASNFERLLFDLYGRDGARLSQLIADFRATKSLTLSADAHASFTAMFAAHAVDDATTLATIAKTHADSGYVLDPHTAVGVAAAQAIAAPGITVTLATAHPAKFPEAVVQATGQHPALPSHMADLFDRAEKITPLANDAAALVHYIRSL
ncbi:MAG: threonine synthase [Azospirillum brasilense]|nr:MAG: threonine synthase [Azospirillum brasilense]